MVPYRIRYSCFILALDYISNHIMGKAVKFIINIEVILQLVGALWQWVFPQTMNQWMEPQILNITLLFKSSLIIKIRIWLDSCLRKAQATELAFCCFFCLWVFSSSFALNYSDDVLRQCLVTMSFVIIPLRINFLEHVNEASVISSVAVF